MLERLLVEFVGHLDELAGALEVGEGDGELGEVDALLSELVDLDGLGLVDGVEPADGVVGLVVAEEVQCLVLGELGHHDVQVQHHLVELHECFALDNE